MEYIFGDDPYKQLKTLRTKQPENHSELEGYITVVHEYPDQTITDSFRIVEKYHTDEDTAGNCYDWYYIDQYYRYVDPKDALRKDYTQKIDTCETAMCDIDTDLNASIQAIEDALCELDMSKGV